MSLSTNSNSLAVDEAVLVERDQLEMPGILNASDESWVTALEKTAANAPRIIEAMNKILVKIAYPGDWVSHNGKNASLCAAGAERFMKFFPFKFTDWSWEKQKWTDGEGAAYRYIYRATCKFNGSEILVEGKYSTRDKLLGFKDEKWRPLEEINENDIQNAARHICIAEGVKAHLGLRAVPVESLSALGVTVKNVVEYTKGGQGGRPEASDAEQAKQERLKNMLLAIANGDPDGAGDILQQESAFTGRDGNAVKGVRMASRLTGKRLDVNYDNIKRRYIGTFGREQYDNDIEKPAAKQTNGKQESKNDKQKGAKPNGNSN